MTPGEQTRDFYRKQGAQAEQERIIKLLEPLTICDEDCDHYNCGTWALKQGIALIKGENK